MKKTFLNVKFRIVLTALFCTLSSWAQGSNTITINSGTGTFYRSTSSAITPSSTAQYANRWVSNSTSPILTLMTNANNMVIDTEYGFRFHADTYQLSISEGYNITGYEITCYTNYTGGSTINGFTISTDSANPSIISASNLSTQTISFPVANTATPWIVIQSFKVYYETGEYLGVTELSNSKAYTLTTSRGSLGVSSNQLVATSAGYDASTFALLSYNNQNYLYSIASKSFVNSDGTLTNTTYTPITIEDLGNNQFMLKYDDSNIINMNYSSNGVQINAWSTVDAGNSFQIIEAADFNPTEALAVLNSGYNPEEPSSNYERALATIQDGASYRICTDVNGTKYYVTEAGTLTSAKAEGGIFTITKVSGGEYKEYGFRIDSGTMRFTNPPLSNNTANLTPGAFATTSTNDRNLWETQVLFLNDDGQYAIRSCNTEESTTSWRDCGRTYWTWAVESVPTPRYTYDPTYVWQIEATSTLIQVTYALYDTDGQTILNSITKQQEQNSAINVPAELTNSYAYDYITTGTIGSTDCTIKVTRTAKSNIVHALSKLSNAKAYTIHCDRGSFFTTDNHLASTSKPSFSSEEPSNFAIINYQSKYYLYSITDKKFVTNSGDLANAPNSTDAIIMEAQTDPYFFCYFSIGGTNNGLNTCGDYTYGLVINDWMTIDAGNQYYMVETADFDPTEAIAALTPSQRYTVTFNVTYKGSVVATATVDVGNGSALPAMPEALINSYVSLTEVGTFPATVTDDVTVYYDATWNGPFAFSTSLNDATWYNMTIRNSYWVVKNDTEPYYPTSSANLTANESQWAFGGDPYHVKIYNRSTGFDMTLTKEGVYAVMRSGDYTWDIRQESNGFFIRESGTSYNCLNHYGGTSGPLRFWYNPASLTDSGSIFRVETVTTDDSKKIQFDDDNVKALCVANWDTNGDGELSMNEAAAVTSLGQVFKNNKNITSFDELQYFTSLTSIDSETFYYCQLLWSIIIPNNVITIGDGAFSGCYNLLSITLPNGLTSVGDSSFAGCGRIESISLPNSVTRIGNNTFSYCTALSSFTIPTNITNIDDYTFRECNSLTSIDIPAGVTRIGNNAFNGCTSLSSITIPNSVESIGDWAFSDCVIASVTIPATVNSIGEGAFLNCSNLTSVTSDITTPFSMADNVFQGVNSSCVLSVPAGKKSLYEKTTGWHEHFSKIVEIGGSEPQPYAVLSSDNTVLTFYYDDQKESRGGMSVGPFSGSSARGWDNQREAITTVVFDASFANCTSLTSTAHWFDLCSNLTTITGIEKLKTDNVTDMHWMFYDCSSLMSLDVSGFKTDKVTDMSWMFRGCSKLTNLDVSGFKTDNVTDMNIMFYGCSSLTSLDVSSFKTNNVTNMGYMFYGCSSLTSLDVSGFKTDNVKDMSRMFYGCSKLTSLEVSGFKTDNVTGMVEMFRNCSSLTSLDVRGFKTDNVTDMYGMFYNCYSLTTIYIGDGWSTKAVISGAYMFNNCSKLVGCKGTTYDSSHIDETYAHIDEGTANPGYFTSINKDPQPYAVLSSDNTILTFYYDDKMESRGGMSVGPFSESSARGWNNQREAITTVVFDASFANCTSLTSTTCWFNGFSNLITITGIESLKTDNVTRMSFMFDGCSSLTSLDVSGFKTDKVTDMSYMFGGCSNLTSLDVSGFKTDNVTDMSGLFDDCSSLTSLDVTGFKTDNVTNMYFMFYGCSSLTSFDVSGFKTDNVTDMGEMFGSCSSLTSLDVSGFKTHNVTNMYGMFGSCSSLTNLDVNGFKTDEVTNMCAMFNGCSSLTNLDVSDFKTDKVTNMSYMFGECYNLTTIFVGEGWSTKKVTEGTDMFHNCSQLVGGKGTTYDRNHRDHTYAHIDGGTSNPGYLSGKNTVITVKILNVTREYGEANPVFDFFTDATNLDGTPTITCEATTKSPVGEYPIIVSKGSITRTDVTYVNGTLTITKAPLKVSVKNASRYIGEENPSFELVYSGFKNGETETVLTKKPVATCQANDDSGAGTYTITISGGEATNYTLSYETGTLTVDVPPTDIFVVDNMTFQVSGQLATKGVTFVKGPETAEAIVPESITYKNDVCPVTAVGDGAFANRPQLKSVKIPAAIKTVGKDLFTNSPHLAAIIWEVPMKMTKEMAGSVANNPNLLFYTSDPSYALDGVTNIVNTKTKQAERIVLTDAEEDNDFYCPEEFKANEITYTHEYKLFTVTGNCQGWETLALPFNVTEITHEKNGTIVPFGSLQIGYEFKEDNRPFWLYEYTTRGTFAEAEGIKANVPYIISMPNEYKLWEGYILKGKVTFKGTNTAVKATSTSKIVKSGNRSFTPNYQNGTSETVYLMNITDSYDGYPKGSVFVKNYLLERNARPFEAYFELESGAGVKEYFSIFEQLADEIRTIEDTRWREKEQGESDNEYYQLDGTKRTKPQHGFNIVRTKDGKTLKLLVK